MVVEACGLAIVTELRKLTINRHAADYVARDRRFIALSSTDRGCTKLIDLLRLDRHALYIFSLSLFPLSFIVNFLSYRLFNGSGKMLLTIT